MKGWGNRDVADVFGGFDGGWYFWRAALAAIEVAVERSLEREQSFGSYPPGELRRFQGDVEAALELASLAVAVQEAINGDESSASIVDVLADRLRTLKADRRL